MLRNWIGTTAPAHLAPNNRVSSGWATAACMKQTGVIRKARVRPALSAAANWRGRSPLN
ncbi:hypothetical protein D3C81_2149710 [compost metagenome]